MFAGEGILVNFGSVKRTKGGIFLSFVHKCIVCFSLMVLSSELFASFPKYIFYFIGDGMGHAHVELAEKYSLATGRGGLAINSFTLKRSITTHPFTSELVTDSAAAGTALACGVKTRIGMLGVDAATNPVPSCAAIAKEKGMKVGIIATVMTTHATPAAFYAHQSRRSRDYEIAIELVHSGFDYFAGGGLGGRYDDKKSKQYMKYGNAYDYAESAGYKIIRTRDEFLALKSGDGKVLTRFTDGHLTGEIDVRLPRTQPTLAEMVSKGIELLDGPQGFFIMAEGSRIDWSCHSNDAKSMVLDVLGMDDAVKVALEFSRKHPDETLIVVVADHETGGLTLREGDAAGAENLRLLDCQKISMNLFSKQFVRLLEKKRSLKFDDVKNMITEFYGFKFAGDCTADKTVLSAEETNGLEKAFEQDKATCQAKVKENTGYMDRKHYVFSSILCRLLNGRAGVCWKSSSHTGCRVPLIVHGCKSEAFAGNSDNTDVGITLKRIVQKEVGR